MLQQNGDLSRSAATVSYAQCQPGTVRDANLITLCDSCSLFVQFERDLDCLACTVGKAVNVPGQTACFDCAPGTFTARNGTINCGPCEVGHYQDEQGKSECKDCLGGTYADSEGQLACKTQDL